MSQRKLGEFGSNSHLSDVEADHASDTEPSDPKLGFRSRPPVPDIPAEIADARNADWVVHTGRYPHVFDAARLGYTIGHREDLSYGWVPDEVTLRTQFLDNNYENPDLERFVDGVFQHAPDVAVLGDIYASSELQPHLDAAEEVWGSFPDTELILVPKCRDVLEDIPEAFVLGFPNGTSDIQGEDIAPARIWRQQSNRLHILGGPPLSTYNVIQRLTTNSLTGEPPADIAGLDWNGYQKFAQAYGDYADATGGWHETEKGDFAKRDLIRWSLLNGKHFYLSRGIWPADDIAETIDDVPLRPALTDAASGDISPRPAAHQDIQALQHSPRGSQTAIDQPIYRTDETQDVVFEPLAPFPSLLKRLHRWRPAGSLDTSTTCSSPDEHDINTICMGCGVDVLRRPQETRKARSKSLPDTGPAHSLEATVVSYEHYRTEESQHYDSIRKSNIKSLNPTTKPGYESRYPTLQLFCSELCQQRVEARASRQLLARDSAADLSDSPQYPSGTPVGELTVPLQNY